MTQFYFIDVDIVDIPLMQCLFKTHVTLMLIILIITKQNLFTSILGDGDGGEQI